MHELNTQQTKAVAHKYGPLLIVAGAGTGKTTVITRRIAWLISQKLAKPGEILALTFTDKAAEEMETRVDQLVPYGYIDVSISTFHSFGDRVLRDQAIDAGLRPDYKVITLPEQLVFLREHIFDLPLKHYRSLGDPTRHLEALLKAISRAQDDGLTPQEYLKAAATAEEKEVARVYRKYQALKAEKGFVDFSDQVGLALRLFRQRPLILKKYQERFKFILVDEFQDTNYAQFELLKLLAGKKANLTVVGDDDQSIYAFRGAAISNILNFKATYKNSKVIVLTKNFRSNQMILDTAYRLIKHNDPDRLESRLGIDKRLVALPEAAGCKPEYRFFDSSGAEADWVAGQIRDKQGTGSYKYSDFAVLVRANSSAEEIKRSLNMLGIPYRFSGGGGLYANPEIQLLSSFLCTLGDLSDSVSLYHLALSEIYRIPPLDLQKLNTFADRRNLTMYHVLARLDLGEKGFEVLDDISAITRQAVAALIADIAYYLNYAKERTTGEVLYLFLKRTGYLEKLTREENDRRLRNIAGFFNKVKEFKEVVECDRVTEFVKYFKLLKEAGDNPEAGIVDEDTEAVQLLTVHKAKGLEFRVVFLPGLVTDKFPLRARQEPSGDFHLQEERRLFYVALTRAKEELYLTSAADYGGKRERKVSRFVLEAVGLPHTGLTAIKRAPREQIELFAPVPEETIPAPSLKADGVVHLSYYQIEDYLTCPLKYRFAHVWRVPLLPNHNIIYGNVLHLAAQTYDLARLNGKKFSEKDLQKILKDNWTAEGYISREHEEQRFASAKAALTLFAKQQNRSKRKLLYAEEPFSVPFGKILLRGRFDRIDREGNRTYIVDFKSSGVKSQAEADKKAKASLQLAIYSLVWQEKFKERPHRVELYFFESGLVGATDKSPRELDTTLGKIEKVAAGIRRLDFHATPSRFACSYCAYNEICPRAAV